MQPRVQTQPTEHPKEHDTPPSPHFLPLHPAARIYFERCSVFAARVIPDSDLRSYILCRYKIDCSYGLGIFAANSVLFGAARRRWPELEVPFVLPRQWTLSCSCNTPRVVLIKRRRPTGNDIPNSIHMPVSLKAHRLGPTYPTYCFHDLLLCVYQTYLCFSV